jgi:hypothetical protein
LPLVLVPPILIMNFEQVRIRVHNILEPTTGVTFFNSGFKSDPTELFPSIEEVSSTKLQFKDRENPTWLWILDAVGCSFALLRRVCWPTLEECYVLFSGWRIPFLASESGYAPTGVHPPFTLQPEKRTLIRIALNDKFLYLVISLS